MSAETLHKILRNLILTTFLLSFACIVNSAAIILGAVSR